MKAFLVVILTLLFLRVSFAQPLDSLWSRTFGGGGLDWCYAMTQATDGGYVLAGQTDSYGAGNNDYWLVKTDANGDSLWSRTFGGSGREFCHSVQQTSDGGYILAGRTTSFGAGGLDFWVVKTDANGDSLWSRTFGGSASDDYCYSAQQTTDGGYILAGWTAPCALGDSNFLLVKTDANGDSLWSRTFGGGNPEIGYAALQTTDGGYLIWGRTASFGAGDWDIWLVKTDADGDSLWSRTFGGERLDNCFCVRQTTDGGYVIAGRTESFGAGSYDFFLVKTDANGDSLWAHTFGGANDDRSWFVQQTTDGGYLIAGQTNSFGAGGQDFWLVKTDAEGDSVWSRTFGGGYDESCWSVQQTPDGGYLLAGITHSFGVWGGDFWLVKTSGIPPYITSITDVGNDQGRQARIRWHRCVYDGGNPSYTITSYSIYRRIDQYLASGAKKAERESLDWPPGEWEYIKTVPARGEAQYATIIPTLADSTSEGIYWSVFFVSAETSSPLVYFDSAPDSGYSIDNLPPDETLVTAMVPTSPGQVLLHWREVTTGGDGQPEIGDIWYRVYGSTDPAFVPGPDNLLNVTQSLEFLHSIGSNDKFFYVIKVSQDH